MENCVEKNSENRVKKDKLHKSVSYARWGVIFIIPFLLVYFIFTLYPQIKTIFYSFFEYYRDGRKWIGPNFNGIDNYLELFEPYHGEIPILKYFWNTISMWIICAIPQFVVALLLAVLFTSTRLNLKFQGFFKTVFYLPNVIMASAFGLLFWALFSVNGPVNDYLIQMGILKERYNWLAHEVSVKFIIAFINYIMWFGNTTIVLMAGIQGIDESIFESARIDGANSIQVFKDITMPLLKPIFIYCFITSMIGGLQMYDVPQIMTNGQGTPDNTSMTIVMYLSRQISGASKNYGMGGAISVVLFIITGILSVIVFKSITSKDE